MKRWTDVLREARVPLQIFFGTRALLWATAVYAWLWLTPRRLQSGDLGYLTRIWARSDSDWFVGIAKHGYQHNGGAVFYPLYPLAMAGLGRALGGYYVTAGIVISLVCGAAAFALLYRLALPRVGTSAASRTLLYLAVFPMTLYLQAVYSESMFLLFAVATFLAAERRRWLLAGTAAGLATLTRIAGVALWPAILLMAWRAPPGERRRAVASLGVAPLLAALYPIWLQIQIHAPRAEFANEAGWNRHLSPAGPFGGAWRGLEAAWAGVEQLVTGDRTHAFWTHSHSDPLYVAAHNLEDFAFFAVFAALGVVAWKRFGAPYGLYVLGVVALAASVPQASYPLLSMPRFCLTLFPAFLALASLATTAVRDRLILIASTLGAGVAVVVWVGGYWVS